MIFFLNILYIYKFHNINFYRDFSHLRVCTPYVQSNNYRNYASDWLDCKMQNLLKE
jgi:hypothetical protein